MKLHKASLFALYAVLELASNPKRQLSASDIAKEYDISPHHLAKVLRNLVRSGLVKAERGVGGGYQFAGNVNRTTLLDVIELFESLESEIELPNRETKASKPVVAELQSIISEIDALTKAVLDTVTLKTALNSTLNRTNDKSAGKDNDRSA